MISIMGVIQFLVIYSAFCISTISYKADLYICPTILLFGMASIVYCIIFSLFLKFHQYFEQIHVVNLILVILLLGLLLRDLQNIYYPGYQKILLIMFLATAILFFTFTPEAPL